MNQYPVINLESHQAIEIRCDYSCDILLMSQHDFYNWQKGSPYHYYGGHYQSFPAIIKPAPGNYVLVVNTGGMSVKYDYRMIG
jgi:hypothetical protein